jgi:beta-glucosidase
MIEASYHFPNNFLWGTATAAHQVEGKNKNNWSEWEKTPGRIVDGSCSDNASGWWQGRWKEDFERAAATGQNAHRFSVEWSRIQPTPDTWDEKALLVYQKMAKKLVDLKMTPFVTLHHFTDPLWFRDKGGWESKESPVLFEKFVRRVVSVLSPYVKFWITVNEPNVYSVMGYLLGINPPGKSSAKATRTVFANLMRGHALAYHAIHSMQQDAKVGFSIHHAPLHPAHKWSPLDRIYSRFFNWNWNDAFPRTTQTGVFRFFFSLTRIPEAKQSMDFLGVNYYNRQFVSFTPRNKDTLFARIDPAKDAQPSRSRNFANDPAGMFETMKWARDFGLPIYITENGIEDEEDILRPRMLVENLHQVWRAANFNWNIKGYFHWSLVDNFEWLAGWTERFGLWGLDIHTQERVKRKSAEIYEAICKENGITSAMVQEFVPESFNILFPV